MNNTVSLSDIVKEYLREKGQDTTHSFPRVLSAAVRALKELNWDITGSLVYAMCQKDSNNQIDIPTDCVRLVDVGVINSSGEFVSIEYNKNYAPRRTYDDCGNEVNLDSGNRLLGAVNDWGRGNNYGGLNVNRHGESVGRNYGIGSHSSIAQYGVDELNGKINISSDSKASNFMLIYLSNLETVNGKIMVHEFMVEPIMAGIEWIMARRLRSIGRGEKQILHSNFINEKNNLSLRMSSLSASQLKFLGRHASKGAKF